MKPEIKKYYYNNGQLMNETHLLNGEYHREDGPAIIYYDKNGNIETEHYFINNRELYLSEFLIYQRKRKLKTIK